MKSSGKNSLLVMMYRVLLVVFIVMGLAWLGGTAWALLFRKVEEPQPALSAPVETALAGGGRIFTGMGRLRLSLAPPSSAVAIVSVTFPYDPGDKAFSEELASRLPDLRNAAVEYFASFGTDILLNKDEAELKAELLSSFNSLLRLGKIEILYFDDYMIID